jgi:hypothetical protein
MAEAAYEGRLEMRQAAGILMVAASMFLFIVRVGHYDVSIFALVFSLLLLIPTVFILIAGVFCLRGRHWKVCYASGFVTLVVMIAWAASYAADSIGLAWAVAVVGTLPIIFVSLAKKEWQEVKG